MPSEFFCTSSFNPLYEFLRIWWFGNWEKRREEKNFEQVVTNTIFSSSSRFNHLVIWSLLLLVLSWPYLSQTHLYENTPFHRRWWNSSSWWDYGFVLRSQMHQSIFSGTNAVVLWQVQLFYISEDSWRCLIFLHKILSFEVFFENSENNIISSWLVFGLEVVLLTLDKTIVGGNGVQWRVFVSGSLMIVDENGVEQPERRKL